MIHPPALSWPTRIAWGLAGLAWFVWLAYEDNGLIAVQLVATLIAAATGLTVLRRAQDDKAIPPRTLVVRCGLVGLLSGSTVGLYAALLITVKVALHAHPQPDFSILDLLRILSRTPVWAAAGLLVGLAGGVAFGFAYNSQREP